MQLGLSRRADYVVRAAIALARSYAEVDRLKVREIAAEMAIPRSYTPQILDLLTQSGLVESKAGKTGGYRLTRAPEEISVLEIIEAGEGSLWPEGCAMSDGPCRWDAVCPLHEIMSAAVSHLRTTFANETLASLAGRDLALERGILEVPLDTHRSVDPTTHMTTSDFIHLELPRADVEHALLNDDTEWLANCANHAAATLDRESPSLGAELHQALGARLSVNLGIVHPEPSVPGPRNGDRDHTIPIVVESSAPEELRIGFVGSILLKTLDGRRTVLELDGKSTFGARLVAPLHAGDQPDPREIATQLMRAFLRSVAEELESRRIPRASLPA